MNDIDPISNLTIGQLKQLIYNIVTEAMAEVLLEFSLAAEHDAALLQRAELTDYLRASINERLHGAALYEDESDVLFDD